MVGADCLVEAFYCAIPCHCEVCCACSTTPPIREGLKVILKAGGGKVLEAVGPETADQVSAFGAAKSVI